MDTTELADQSQSGASLLDKSSSVLQLAAIVSGILASCMLLAGYSYHLGYTQVFGFDSSIFGRGLGDVVMESWIVGIMLLVFFSGYIAEVLWSAAGMAVLLLLALILFVRVREKRPELFSKPFGKQHQGPTFLRITLWQWWVWIEAVAELAGWLLLFFVPLCVAFIVMVSPYQIGKTEAERRTAQYREHGCDSRDTGKQLEACFSLVDISRSNGLLAKGLLVASSEARVALFTDNGLEVWPLLDTYVLSRPYGNRANKEN